MGAMKYRRHQCGARAKNVIRVQFSGDRLDESRPPNASSAAVAKACAVMHAVVEKVPDQEPWAKIFHGHSR